MAKKPATKAEREHYARVVEIGCIVSTCRRPAEIHHLLTGKGLGQKSSNRDVLPLCPIHHRNGGPGIAIHAGVETWQEIYGTELDLLEQVRGML